MQNYKFIIRCNANPNGNVRNLASEKVVGRHATLQGDRKVCRYEG